MPRCVNRADLPDLLVYPEPGECFDCHCARLLLAFHEKLAGQYRYQKEIAEALGIERASLYKRLSRARSRLRSCALCNPLIIKVVRAA
jgi:transcriptional regulator of acetoin/glycerol metabolism